MMNKDEHIDTIRRRFGITLAAVSQCRSLRGDEIKNIGEIFNLNDDSDREKTQALLHMVSEPGGRYDPSPALIARHGTLLAAAMIYNPQFYAMAINYREAVNINFKKKDNIIPFRVTSRMVFAAAAVFAAAFFIALLLLINGRPQRTNNEWIAGLTAPETEDGVSFVSHNSGGARIGIKSPLVGIAMSSAGNRADISASAAHYAKAVKKESNNAAMYVNRGAAYTLQGYLDLAIDDFNKAIEIDPRNTSAYFNRAAAFAGKGEAKMSSAIDDLAAILIMDPHDNEASYALGVLYFKLYEDDETKPVGLLETAVNIFGNIQGYKDADIIFDYLSRLL